MYILRDPPHLPTFFKVRVNVNSQRFTSAATPCQLFDGQHGIWSLPDLCILLEVGIGLGSNRVITHTEDERATIVPATQLIFIQYTMGSKERPP